MSKCLPWWTRTQSNRLYVKSLVQELDVANTQVVPVTDFGSLDVQTILLPVRTVDSEPSGDYTGSRRVMNFAS